MPRRKNAIPEAKKRFHRGSWSVFWRYDGKQFSIALGLDDEEDEKAAEAIRRKISTYLLDGNFLPPYDQTPAVKNYRERRYGKAAPHDKRNGIKQSAETWIADYEPHIRSECAKIWATNSLTYIRNLSETAGGLDNVNHAIAQRFLDAILKTKKTSTRNRCLAACKRFFKWAARTGRTNVNPFEGISVLPEAHAESIMYCTREERERIIAAAMEERFPVSIAIPIAFYTGMRREEISRLKWTDILFDSGRIVVPISKTHKRRALPLAGELRAILEAVPVASRTGHVVPYPRDNDAAWAAAADMLVESLRTRLCRPLKCDDAGFPLGGISKKEFAMTEANLRTKPPKNCPGYAVDAGPWIPAERVAWTAWRHTFGSLLAQAGVSIDKISAWMGNTPEVCRRHYAEFMPRDHHDDEIDKL